MSSSQPDFYCQLKNRMVTYDTCEGCEICWHPSKEVALLHAQESSNTENIKC